MPNTAATEMLDQIKSYVETMDLAVQVLASDKPLKDGTSPMYRRHYDMARLTTEAAAAVGQLSWSHLSSEWFFAVQASENPEKLTGNLLALAALCVVWSRDVERRNP